MSDAHRHRGVVPSLHVCYKRTHLKQYHKEGRACAPRRPSTTPTTSMSGRRLHNLPQLREIGLPPTRKVLEVEVLSHDCQIGARPSRSCSGAVVEGQKVSALKYGEERVQAMLAVLIMFCLLPEGFRNQQLRPLLAQYLGGPNSNRSEPAA